MRIEKCYFCSSSVYPGHGIEFVRNDCKVFRFCRSKCHRNFKMKRNPRKTRWTKAFRKAHGKELAVDNVFAFERHRNEAIPYDRNLVAKTIKVMDRVAEIKAKREARFYHARMKGRDAINKAEALKDLEKGIDLIIAPNAKEQILQTVEATETQSVDAPKEVVTKKKTTGKKKSTKKPAVSSASMTD